jgi:hypothetical protein
VDATLRLATRTRALGQQDFFDPIWTQGWRAGDLVQIGVGQTAANGDAPELEQHRHLESWAAS